MADSHVPRRHYQSRVNTLAHGPSNNPSAVKIQDCRQVNRPHRRTEIGNISHPNPIRRTGRRHSGQAIGGNWMRMVAVCSSDLVTALLPAPYSRFSHESAQPVSAMPLAQSTQAGLDARAAIGLPTIIVNAPDLLFEPKIFLDSPWRLALTPVPIVISAGRDFERLTEHGNRMSSFQGVDPFEALFGGSEMIPKVFFKMSRC